MQLPHLHPCERSFYFREHASFLSHVHIYHLDLNISYVDVGMEFFIPTTLDHIYLIQAIHIIHSQRKAISSIIESDIHQYIGHCLV